MARPKTDDAIDLSVAHELTAPLIRRFTCPTGLPKAFLRDKAGNGLRVRVTANGAKAFVYEAKIKGKAFSRTLGNYPLMTIAQAQAAALNIAQIVKNDKRDPREIEREAQEAKALADTAAAAQAEMGAREAALKVEADAIEAAAADLAAKVAALTVGEVWTDYLEQRRPHWGALHYRDHLDKASAGGLPSKRRGAGDKLTQPGPLAALMPLALRDLDQHTIEAWAAKEGLTRPSSARLAWRLLTVFLTWCAEQPDYAALLPAKNPAKAKKARESLGKAGTKKDVLQKGQLKTWFTAVRQIQNPTISACLQVLLLTGARLNEVLTMRWDDVNTQWKGISINDKVEGSREIPLTPYVERLITALPRRNEYVFASARTLVMNKRNILRRERKSAAKGKTPPAGAILETSATGYISEPNTPHTRACRAAGLDGLTLHGLRRSFKSLTEWQEVPVGVVAQIMGHKASATAEKHYTVRPLELLALHHNRIEAWILEQAGIVFDATAEPGKLQAVNLIR